VFISIYFQVYVSKSHVPNMIFLAFCFSCGACLCCNHYELYKSPFLTSQQVFKHRSPCFKTSCSCANSCSFHPTCFYHVLSFHSIKFSFGKHVFMMFCKIFSKPIVQNILNSINYNRYLCNITNKQCCV
jgi:hypothetical protein